MPRLDGTGPMGKGQGTGRGRGRCSENGNFGQGQGLGRRGRFGNGNNSDELTLLKNRAEILQNELNKVNEKITELGQ